MRTQRADAPFLFRVSARVMTAGKMRSRCEGAGGVRTGRMRALHMSAGPISAFRKTPPLMRVYGRIK